MSEPNSSRYAASKELFERAQHVLAGGVSSEFRKFAHPHFAKGKAWSFRATRRAVMIGAAGRLAWFDEDLATPNLGPARGSGVLRKLPDGGWRIVHYNLTITVPNERFKEVKALLEAN